MDKPTSTQSYFYMCDVFAIPFLPHLSQDYLHQSATVEVVGVVVLLQLLLLQLLLLQLQLLVVEPLLLLLLLVHSVHSAFCSLDLDW